MINIKDDIVCMVEYLGNFYVGTDSSTLYKLS